MAHIDPRQIRQAMQAADRQDLAMQQAQQAHIAQLYHSCYLSLVPVFAADELKSHEGWQNEELNMERVAKRADRMAIAAMKQMGIEISKAGLE